MSILYRYQQVNLYFVISSKLPSKNDKGWTQQTNNVDLSLVHCNGGHIQLICDWIIHSALEICWEYVWIHHQWYEMILVQTWCKSNKKMHISLVIPKKWIKHGIWVYPMFSQHLILCLPLLANHRWLRTWRRFGYHRLYDWAPGDGLGQCGGLKECQLMSVIWVFLKTEHRQVTMSFNTKVVSWLGWFGGTSHFKEPPYHIFQDGVPVYHKLVNRTWYFTMVYDTIKYTLWLFSIAMDNGPCMDDSWWFTY